MRKDQQHQNLYDKDILSLYIDSKRVFSLPNAVAIPGGLFAGVFSGTKAALDGNQSAFAVGILWGTAVAFLLWSATLFFLYWNHKDSKKTLQELALTKYVVNHTPVVVENKVRTDGGQRIDRKKPPLPLYTTIQIAQHILSGGDLTFRSTRSFISDEENKVFRTWLCNTTNERGEPLAYMTKGKECEIMPAGLQVLANIVDRLPPPTDGISLPIGFKAIPNMPTHTQTQENE